MGNLIEIAAIVGALAAAFVLGLFTLGGVAVGAFLTPYFETRWARSLRAHQIRLDSLVELHDTYDQWIEAVTNYRSIRVVYLDRDRSLSKEWQQEYLSRSREYVRLENRVHALVARLGDKELGKAVSLSVATVTILLQDDQIDDNDAFHHWMIDASGTVSTRIGKRTADEQHG